MSTTLISTVPVSADEPDTLPLAAIDALASLLLSLPVDSPADDQ